MAHAQHEAAIKFVAYWDRDERGDFAEVEIQDCPEWMTPETCRLIERDISVSMEKNRRKK